ncbi:protein-disulfide reductase DsbD [Thiolapillus brandeum]|uniref:Thiol:disulfide interchange protein DsbD n=1 Tax=Thiolapillus brandeum TaxID=1076588 RepID=A0A7U6GG09_9GAMM|nr:protein-disulfide reductase DsbD [Thiolapillus brandeum]BAO42965.1 thiol:disulfide interchange protein DsbD [Thiolapillus brandeum]
MHRLIAFLLLLTMSAGLLAEEEFLKPDQAYSISATTRGDKIIVHWDIADGYYLYRNKFRFSSRNAAITLGSPELPPGITKQDPFFGEIEIYKHGVDVVLPLHIKGNHPNMVEIEARSQGCAEAGICYPPHTQKLLVALDALADAPPPVTASAAEDARENLVQAGGSEVEAIAPPSSPAAASSPSPLDALGALGDDLGLEEDGILKPDQAYRPMVESSDGKTLNVHWEIADGTYLYEDKIQVSIQGSGIKLGQYSLPSPKIKHDSIKPDGSVGDVAVFVHNLDLNIPLLRSDNTASEATVTLKYQGCAERGICYPPQKKQFKIQLPAIGDDPAPKAAPVASPTAQQQAVQNPPATNTAPVEQSEQDQIASMFKDSGTWLIVLTFFGLGLLLAFTPCVFPMIPILSGIIAGQGSNITTRRAFTLSMVYVLAMAVTYTIVGVLAGLFGASFNLTAAFQNPWILSAFALLFVLLSLSMFGFYELQLPASWQSKLTEISNKQKGGELGGVAIMGLLSALIVGPCVAPPLAGTLIYIGQTGDALLGGIALFAMAMGMGAPLIAIGTSAGKLLPQAGGWMDAVKAVFGVMMLGLAITMLERFLPPVYPMALWGILLIVSAVYMGAMRQLPVEASGWSKLWKGLGVVLLVYGILFMVGVAANGKDTVQPLRGLAIGGGGSQQASHLQFKRIKNVSDLQRELARARAAGKPVMLDFYADWCIYCKQMEKNVFNEPAVVSAMGDFVLLQADVTEQDEQDKALMDHVKIPAPPAMLFWGRNGSEIKHLRLMGYMNMSDFLTHVHKVP